MLCFRVKQRYFDVCAPTRLMSPATPTDACALKNDPVITVPRFRHEEDVTQK